MSRKNRFFTLLGTLVITASIHTVADATTCDTCRDITNLVTARWQNGFGCSLGSLSNPGIPNCTTCPDGSQDCDEPSTMWHDDNGDSFCEDGETGISAMRSCGTNNDQGCNDVCKNILTYGGQFCDYFVPGCIFHGTVGNVDCTFIRGLRDDYVTSFTNAGRTSEITSKQEWCNGVYEANADQNACLTCLNSAGDEGSGVGGSGGASINCSELQNYWVNSLGCTLGESYCENIEGEDAETWCNYEENEYSVNPSACLACVMDECGSGGCGSGGGGGPSINICNCWAGTYYSMDACANGCYPCPPETYCDDENGCKNNCNACPTGYNPPSPPRINGAQMSIAYSAKQYTSGAVTSSGAKSIAECYIHGGLNSSNQPWSYWYESDIKGTYKKTISTDCYWNPNASSNSYGN